MAENIDSLIDVWSGHMLAYLQKIKIKDWGDSTELKTHDLPAPIRFHPMLMPSIPITSNVTMQDTCAPWHSNTKQQLIPGPLQ